jgi:hypothetical protein
MNGTVAPIYAVHRKSGDNASINLMIARYRPAIAIVTLNL